MDHCSFWAYALHSVVALIFGPIVAFSVLALPPFNKHERDLGVTLIEVALVSVLETLLVTFIVCEGTK
jgi:hypothetical protein